jgi:hypothetical protein
MPFDHTDFFHISYELDEGILTDDGLITNFNEFHAGQIEYFEEFWFFKGYQL